MKQDCIFCKIVAGELPSARVYEDDHTLAFLDIAPVVKGHTLVIPRTHHDRITDAPDEVLAHVVAAVSRVARALVASLGADGFNVTQANGEIAGQVVPHLHFHVIPRFARDGRVRHWKQGSYDGADEMAALAETIRGGFTSGEAVAADA
jgi:histidine triad (HIT) family protein